MYLAKEISRQSIRIVSCLLIALYNIQKERNELKVEMRGHRVSKTFWAGK
jgi:hypothetical protein